MIAKISRGTNMIGALSYNLLKVDEKNGQVLDAHKIIETPEGNYTVMQLYRSFAPYFIANKKTEKPVLHISLNPDPGDKVTDDTFRQMAKDYMEEMGYGQQPYVVCKHTDIERTHIHIVSICVDQHGKKISDTYEKLRSMKACRALEQKYNLIPAKEKKRAEKKSIFYPVDHKAGDIKSRIAAVVRYLPGHYSFGSLGAYNALLSLFNLRAEEVTGESFGKTKKGLVYFALNKKGEKASPPFKASLFGKQAGLEHLNTRIQKLQEQMKTHTARAQLRDTIETILNLTGNESDFKAQLVEQGINTVIRRTENGRIYGMTFIDHESRTVWNGSQLSKKLSANAINDNWKGQEAEQLTNTQNERSPELDPNSGMQIEEKEETHALFDFLNQGQRDFTQGALNLIDGLLPGNQGEDEDEMAFTNRMKKKRKRKMPK